MKKLKVLVADNQVVVRQQLLQELRKDEYIEIVGAVDNGKDAYEIFEREEPNIVIFDLPNLIVSSGFTIISTSYKSFSFLIFSFLVSILI